MSQENRIRSGDRVESIACGYYMGSIGMVLDGGFSYTNMRYLPVKLDNGETHTFKEIWLKKIK